MVKADKDVMDSKSCLFFFDPCIFCSKRSKKIPLSMLFFNNVNNTRYREVPGTPGIA